MRIYNNLAFGWKYNQFRNRAVIRKKSRLDFVLSIIIAFLIIFIVTQLLGQLDKVIRDPVSVDSLSLINPLKINKASAAEEETFKMIQSHREINIVKGKGFTFEVGFKNKTNYTWTKTGANSVDLKLAPPYNRQTVLRHKFWRDIETPAWLKDDVAKPGWLAYYQFALEAPTEAGVYNEKFVLVSYKDGHILSGSEFEITLNVWNDASEFPKNNVAKNSQPQVKAQPQPQPQPVPTQEQTKLKNLAKMCSELTLKKFKLASVTQQTVDDCKNIGIDLTPNIWPDDQPASQPQVDPAPALQPITPSAPVSPSTSNSSDGPTMRIGLFYTGEPIIIKSNYGYQIKDPAGNILKAIAANQTATYNFSANLYYYDGQSTSSYLRLEADNPSNVFEIVSYESRPAWNTSLNDNKFLGKLEIRYAPKTNRLWVINELPMETYLKGLAESSNSSPLEYQKALITAARTYAMHHYNRATKHADEYFTLDARYDQVYKGYGSQIRLTKVSEAVEATKGQVVTYNGEIAITPYFSHSDGRTRSWSEVWGGNIAWCQSVPEPAGYDKTTLYGHGVGMSAHGALLLAEDHNYNYEQILKYYYTGIELKKIY